jgi:hypothetical protein
LIKKRGNNIFFFLSFEEINEWLAEVKNSKIILNTPDLKKNHKDNKNVYKYKIISISVKYSFIKSVKCNESGVLYYVINGSLFVVLGNNIISCIENVSWYR